MEHIEGINGQLTKAKGTIQYRGMASKHVGVTCTNVLNTGTGSGSGPGTLVMVVTWY